MSRQKKAICILALVAVLLLPALTSRFMRRAEALDLTWEVTSTGDAADANIGNGTCATAGAVCTLRAAIQEANAAAGLDTIEFNIAGGGVQTITPATPLPDITSPVTIEGLSQPGSSCGNLVRDNLVSTAYSGANEEHVLLIMIDGQNLASGNTLSFVAGSTGSTLSGMVLSGHNVDGANIVNFAASLSGTVECNYIGTDAIGSTTNMVSDDIDGIRAYASTNLTITNNLLSGNTSDGISTSGGGTIEGNLIGTDAGGEARIRNWDNGIESSGGNDALAITNNVITGNQDSGIYVTGSNKAIDGNYIGLFADGSAFGNSDSGIYVGSSSSDNTIGTTTRNVISANGGDGIVLFNFQLIDGGCPDSVNIGNEIANNYIGTTAAGDVSISYGNEGSGILIYEQAEPDICAMSIYDNVIGGADTSMANIIAGNEGDGVSIFQTDGGNVYNNAILSNSIHSNDGLGIDIGHDSAGEGEMDTDDGPNPINAYEVAVPTERANQYINYPTIDEVVVDDESISISYDFDGNESDGSVDVAGYRLDFYISNAQDGSEYGEGEIHLGSFFVDGDTIDTHSFTRPDGMEGQIYISATATVLISEEEEVGFNNNSTNWFARPFAAINNFFFKSAQAAEVDEETVSGEFGYAYGSTSEFSRSYGVVLGTATTTADDEEEDESLAATGTSIINLTNIGILSLLIGIGLVLLENRLQKPSKLR